jgi:hypothetical protein
MKRSFAKLALLLSLALGLAYSADAAADEACTIAVKGATPTARACARGGRAEAKKVMKEMVTAAGKNGAKFSCTGCHADVVMTFELNKNAVEDYKKLQAASGMK